MDPFEKWRNPSGTYNGAAMFAELTGITQEEILWSVERMKDLKKQGLPRAEWARIVRDETKLKPWLTP